MLLATRGLYQLKSTAQQVAMKVTVVLSLAVITQALWLESGLASPVVTGRELEKLCKDHKDEECINSLLSKEKKEKLHLYGGDILLTPVQKEIINNIEKENHIEKRAVVQKLQSLWPKGVVPYIISSELGTSARKGIAAAIKKYQENTCIRFVKRTYQTNYVSFIKDSGCYSYVGVIGGRQPISIGSGCEGIGVIIHEIFHALGRWHEQSRPDRDGYVRINLENIQTGTESNFRKLTATQAATNGVPYDFSSVMHYSAYAFSRNGRPTIDPVVKSVSRDQLGQRNGFSTNDLIHIQKLYCSNQPVAGSWNTWSYWSACSASCGSSGRQSRSRTCLGGVGCLGGHTETRICNNVACTFASWTQWGEWTPCSSSCGRGFQSRTRGCQGGTDCKGRWIERRSCNGDCWGPWSQWGACSATCRGGTHSRIRVCQRGRCPGSATELKSCNMNTPCGQWSSWSGWGACSVTCGTGQQQRTRTCIGTGCRGQSNEERICLTSVCPVLSEWSDWGSCSEQCGAGTQKRTRSCVSGQCTGALSENRDCVKAPLCPIIAADQWGPWSNWSPCSSTCGFKGTRQRTRSCNTGNCVGFSKKVEKCNHEICPELIGEDPNWFEWSAWSTCSRSCNTGYQYQRRRCDFNSATNGKCNGLSFRVQGCNYQKCPLTQPTVVIEAPYNPQGFSHLTCKAVNTHDSTTDLLTLNQEPVTGDIIQECVRLASNQGFRYVGVAGSYCLSGSNNEADYSHLPNSSSCDSSGLGQYTSTSLLVHMNVYKINTT